MKVLLSCLGINGAVASIEEAILDDFDMDFDFGDELEFGEERFLNDEDTIGDLIIQGAGAPVAGDINGDGVRFRFFKFFMCCSITSIQIDLSFFRNVLSKIVCFFLFSTLNR